MREEVKFHVGKKRIKGSIEPKDDRLIIRFSFHRPLIAEIKEMEGARWNPDNKYWTIPVTQRNKFQLAFLMGQNSYAHWDQPLKTYETGRDLRKHQHELACHGITYHYCIFAAEMGTGKTLAAIEVAEYAKLVGEAWWIGPKSALRSVELEFDKWKCKVNFRTLTYEALKKVMEHWQDGDKAPQLVIFDESSRAKNPTAQRSQAALGLADGVRNDWGDNGYVIEMSGSPAPKSPADWWHQCEIAAPGFLREGNIDKFKRRLGLIVDKESIQGGVYPHLVTWLDDERKCKTCGQFESASCHDPIAMVAPEASGPYHVYSKSVNEVSDLYERMKGLVIVKFKKDCLDLPDKQYRIIQCKPSQQTLRSASIITSKSSTVIGAMVLLRELSDGFQYIEEEVGIATCSLCMSRGVIKAPIAPDNDFIEVTEDNMDQYPDCEIGDIIEVASSNVSAGEYVGEEEISCPKCGGCGQVATYKREAVLVDTPKEKAMRDLLDEYEEVGRTVFYGGFTGSIDRMQSICVATDWKYIRVDGRGWSTNIPGVFNAKGMLKAFQAGPTDELPRVAFLGQPGAAGMGLTLTASPMICYWSNDFNAESRIQSEDRIHRMGMDTNRGATIIDLIHLPTDEMVLKNLQKKKDLQAISMGDLRSIMLTIPTDGPRKL